MAMAAARKKALVSLVVQDHEEKKWSITMRLQRLEGIVGRSFVRRLDLLEECCGIVNDAMAGMNRWSIGLSNWSNL